MRLGLASVAREKKNEKKTRKKTDVVKNIYNDSMTTKPRRISTVLAVYIVAHLLNVGNQKWVKGDLKTGFSTRRRVPGSSRLHPGSAHSRPAKSHDHQWDLDHCIYLVNISTADLDNCISLFSKIG
ncbi:hypothetical protein PoMZ_12376 [Pyricularia oryzae]|uniref:Uncharacterized protein n=1 Tax=Pyricularia oryzae TaxID=318829 RepID=A0A4P7NSI4_PYROR|nr:hypothetical protein PoMZ_12376 [Pyricularia oryzae]